MAKKGKKKGKKSKGSKSDGKKHAVNPEELLERLEQDHKIVEGKFYKKRNQEMINVQTRLKEVLQEVKDDYFFSSQSLMDDLDIFKYRTQYGSDKKPIGISKTMPPKASNKSVVSEESKASKPGIPQQTMSSSKAPAASNTAANSQPVNGLTDFEKMEFSDDNSDFRYVSFLTQLTTLRERFHPLRYFPWLKGDSDLKIFDNVPFGPKIEYNKQLYNLSLRQDEKIKTSLEKIKKANEELSVIKAQVEDLRHYKDVEQYKNEMRIAELKEKIAQNEIINKKVLVIETERHGKSMGLLEQKMYRTIDDINVSSYESVMSKLNKNQLDVFTNYKMLRRNVEIFQTELRKMKRLNDFMASRNLEISKVMDQIDWSISYYSALMQEHQKLSTVLDPKSRKPKNLLLDEPFHGSVIDHWKEKLSTNIEVVGKPGPIMKKLDMPSFKFSAVWE